MSLFNLSIRLGALFGELAVDSIATTGALWIGGGLILLTLAVLGGAGRARRLDARRAGPPVIRPPAGRIPVTAPAPRTASPSMALAAKIPT
ncbi:hypothetical protein ACH4GP_18350 [Streptomyces celluloflavus]|uniref:Uncharacterized protein n=1 Tax=Streptomyces celluloflavus TaxID=58344 RepID=A0ABW7RE50_9ACTN